MAVRSTPAVAVLLALVACGKEAPKEAPRSPSSVGSPRPAADDGVVDKVSDDLYRMLPRPLTTADVELVLRYTPLVDEDGLTFTQMQMTEEAIDEAAWGTISARVSMAYAQLLLAENDVPMEIKAPQLKADIEVVRSFKKRLDKLHEDRRAKEERAINRSGQMESITRPEFISARMESPEKWEPFKEPTTDRPGFRVRVGAGEQMLAVRAEGDLVPKLQRYVMFPGGYYVQDEHGIVIRPTDPK